MEEEEEEEELATNEIYARNLRPVTLKTYRTIDRQRRGTETTPDARLSRGNNYESIYPSHHP